MRRVAVYDALDIRSLLVNLKVEQGFAGSLLDAGNLLAGHVDGGDVLGLEKSFAVHGRGAKNFVIADTNGDVAIVCSGKAFVIKSTSDFADVLFDLMCIDHRSIARKKLE